MTRKSYGETGTDWVRRDLEADGARVAYLALKEVCADKAAPAPARATAGVALLRAAGLQEPKKVMRDVPPHEMTGEELAHGVVLLRDRLAELEARRTRGDDLADPPESDPFG